MVKRYIYFLSSLILFFPLYEICFAQNFEARIISEHGYDNCVELRNKEVRVVLEPNFGGRVLIYSLKNKNILYVNPDEAGTVFSQDQNKPPFGPSAGRFDIGPEKITPPRPNLFMGKYETEITGTHSARMISQPDESTGVQLIRDFVLNENSSHLICSQTIKNISLKIQRYGHWSRTFAVGGGICLVPLNPKSRYPLGYLIYGPGDVMDFHPADEPNIRTREGILEIIGPPGRPKFAMDVSEGWLAYLCNENLLFIKKFKVYPDKIYGEMAANNVSIWYNRDQVCEIEPIGPWENIKPGEAVSFSENWWLFEFPFPEDRTVNFREIKEYLERSR